MSEFSRTQCNCQIVMRKYCVTAEGNEIDFRDDLAEGINVIYCSVLLLTMIMNLNKFGQKKRESE